MPSPLRAVAAASCAALVASGLAVAAVATPAAAGPAASPAPFQVSPSYGRTGTTVTLLANGTTSFAGETGVTFNGLASPSVTPVSDQQLTALVPNAATTGPVDVVEGATTLTGPTFVVQQPTTATAEVSKRLVTFPHSFRIAGHEQGALTGSAAAHQTALVQRRVPGHHRWVRVAGAPTKQTDGHGDVSWVVAPRGNASYRVSFRTSTAYVGRVSSALPVRVSPRLHLHPMATVPTLSTSVIHGSVHPHLRGPVTLQQRVNGTWRKAGRTETRHGRFTFSIRPSALGRLTYRVTRSGDRGHAATRSRALRLQVVSRTLSLGASGRDVLALQKRLHRLHYDVGPRNGRYGYDTLHAVTAFEKVNGLSRDGSTGPQVWSRLNHPRHVHLRHPYRSVGLAVEVNLAKQVLVLARHGKVWRILDTSTAGGYLYTNSQGQTERAITPTGHFTIQYKLTGWDKSPLGELYYPSYFTNTGYAIHGEGNGNSGGEVPPYPNSHGCVRITNNAVLRYYNALTVGTSVWIYK